MPQFVIKRDGSSRSFDVSKICAAIQGAWSESRGMAAFGGIAERLASGVELELGENSHVEDIQDAVENHLMLCGYTDVARAYILYRERHTEARVGAPDPKAISDYIHASKYARHSDTLGRREVYAETVARVEDMHIRRFPALEVQIRAAFDFVRAQKVLPSMRSMQFGGVAVESINLRQYNCSATLIDRPRAFAEALYLLLCGCGVGYSVQFDHVEKLPELARVDAKRVTHHIIGDTIEGWADALDALVRSYLVPESVEYGTYVEFAYHLVRLAGSPLKTSGGRAPGHLALKTALERIRAVLAGAQGRQLRPIECHRVLCHSAEAVLSGGIRRSAMICLFSPDDGEIMSCKADEGWYAREPYFAYANNSAVLVRSEATRKQFARVMSQTKRYGDPGAFFVESIDHVTNPCCEIGLWPVIDGATGWAFCNLCEINGAKLSSREDFLAAAHAATFIGTLQASYTDLAYLGPVSEAIARRDALIGIGITGMQDAHTITCDPENQRIVAANIKEWNLGFARLIGINPAARCTCVKPSGTTSIELGCVGSGIHPHHAERYFRRVTANALETVFQAFQKANPGMCTEMADGKWSIEFPIQAPAGARLREDFDAIGFLEMVRSTQENWVRQGTTRHDGGLRHNVSNTVTVRAGEWDEVEDYVWEHRADFTGVSFLGDFGDNFPFAPFCEVRTEDQLRRWNSLVANYVPVDYHSVMEASDSTSVTQEAACGGGGCEWTPS